MSDQAAAWRSMPRFKNSPHCWVGSYVWIISLGCEGFVTGGIQNGPDGDQIIVRKVSDRTPLELTAQEALDDLIPGVRFLIEERP